MTQPVPPATIEPGSNVPRPRRRGRLVALILVAVILAGAIMAAGAVYTNAFGAGDRFAHLLHRIDLIVDPPPDRATAPTIDSTPRPIARATPSAEPSPSPTRIAVQPYEPTAIPTLRPTPTPTPTPKRKPVTVRVVKKPNSVFISQQTKEWCAPAGVQMVLASLGLADNTERFQQKLVDRVHEWESRRDSLNGGWGPGAMVKALEAYGAPGYEIRAYKRRQEALLDAARAMSETKAPVILIAWRGAHTWVMTGYKATPTRSQFDDAKITGDLHPRPVVPAHLDDLGPVRPGRARSRTRPRCAATSCRGSGRRAATRTATGLFIVAPTIPASKMG